MNISILGSTGSIGTQTLDIVEKNSDMHIVSLTAGKNAELMEKQIRKFHPRFVCMADESAAADLRVRVADTGVTVLGGADGLVEAAVCDEADIVVTAVVGIAGLKPTVAAIKAGKNIALANKETMVTAGYIVTRLAKENNVKIYPVDSEHSAIFQALECGRDNLSRIILTASGGPFFGKKRSELENITPQQAIKHPNWDMGAKVTIDSATLVNKGLEVMEARWLFDVDYDNIDVLVHRQSVIHSMIEYEDGAVIAQLGIPDMHLPIAYALTYPDRRPIGENKLDFTKYNTLTFDKPDTEVFPALSLAYKAGRSGGILPTVFNGADEAAFSLFMSGKLKFLEIAEFIEKKMSSAPHIENPTLDDIFLADRESRLI